MAVAKSQLQELLTTILKWIPYDQIGGLLFDLAQTQAYRKNSSFRETVDRLLEMVGR